MVATMKLHVLASGSKGNAAIIENELTGEGVLVDCGLCKRDFLARAAEAGFDVARLRAVLVTHEHSDHTKCLGVVMRGLAKQGINVPLYTGGLIATLSAPIREVQDTGLTEVHAIHSGDSLSLAGMQIQVFPTSHDAAQSFGFRFETNEDAIGFMTDSGIVTGEAHEALANVRILAIEANHDPKMLAEGPYPYVIKRRIASDIGHLSNEQSAQELAALLGNRLEQVVAMHISENNNTYRLPAESLASVVANHAHGAKVQSAYQRQLVSVG